MRKIVPTVLITMVFSTGMPLILFADESVVDSHPEGIMDHASSESEKHETFTTQERRVVGNPDVWVAEGDRTTFTTSEGEVTYEYKDVNGLAVAVGRDALCQSGKVLKGGRHGNYSSGSQIVVA